MIFCFLCKCHYSFYPAQRVGRCPGRELHVQPAMAFQDDYIGIALRGSIWLWMFTFSMRGKAKMKKKNEGHIRIKKIIEKIKAMKVSDKLAVIAIIISVVSMSISLYFSHITYELESKIQQPYLTVDIGEYRERVSVTLLNEGDGSAVIEDIKIWEGSVLKDSKNLSDCIMQRLEDTTAEVFHYEGEQEEKAVEIQPDNITYYENDLVHDAITDDDSAILLQFESGDSDQIHAMRHALLEYTIEVSYRATYEDAADIEVLEIDFDNFAEMFIE